MAHVSLIESFPSISCSVLVPTSSRYISGLVAWLYILLLPFVACIPALEPLVQILLRIVQFPLVAGRNIRDGTMNIESSK